MPFGPPRDPLPRRHVTGRLGGGLPGVRADRTCRRGRQRGRAMRCGVCFCSQVVRCRLVGTWAGQGRPPAAWWMDDSLLSRPIGDAWRNELLSGPGGGAAFAYDARSRRRPNSRHKYRALAQEHAVEARKGTVLETRHFSPPRSDGHDCARGRRRIDTKASASPSQIWQSKIPHDVSVRSPAYRQRRATRKEAGGRGVGRIALLSIFLARSDVPSGKGKQPTAEAARSGQSALLLLSTTGRWASTGNKFLL